MYTRGRYLGIILEGVNCKKGRVVWYLKILFSFRFKLFDVRYNENSFHFLKRPQDINNIGNRIKILII